MIGLGLVVIVLIIGFAGIISNQVSGLRRMEDLQRSLDDLNQKLRDVQKKI